ncbi:MAG: YggS family pyridoxal phosphate-dependent enzyme [Anaerolineales bacterium]
MPSVAEIEVKDRLSVVQERIRAAAVRVGRDFDEIRIVAITKSHPVEMVHAVHRAGLRLIGENRVEEALPKRAATDELTDLEWHMVGHIQSRKAKTVAQIFDAVHSVDRYKLADRLNREALLVGTRIPVLLECNVSGEASKWGWPLTDETSWPETAEEFARIYELPSLEVRGLMTMAPIVVEAELVRPVFRKLRALRDYLRQAISGEWPELSMGMTEDYEVAVEEGATLLRIGRAIFGPRTVG